jgi:hypothetical protein
MLQVSLGQCQSIGQCQFQFFVSGVSFNFRFFRLLDYCYRFQAMVTLAYLSELSQAQVDR